MNSDLQGCVHMYQATAIASCAHTIQAWFAIVGTVGHNRFHQFRVSERVYRVRSIYAIPRTDNASFAPKITLQWLVALAEASLQSCCTVLVPRK